MCDSIEAVIAKGGRLRVALAGALFERRSDSGLKSLRNHAAFSR